MSDQLIYRVDGHSRLSSVNRAWDAFALANGAPQLTGEAVVGRAITDFISGSETKHLYQLLIRRAQREGGPVAFRFRCDAPDLVRSMQMRVEAVAGGEVEFCSEVVATRPRAPIAVLRADAAHDTSAFLRLCSWCNRGEVEGRWLEIERVVRALDLFGARTLPALTHGVCDDCHRQVALDLGVA